MPSNRVPVLCVLVGPLAAPDAVAATKNKVPGVRAETLAWLGYCVENTKKALLQKSIKDLAPVLVEVRHLKSPHGLVDLPLWTLVACWTQQVPVHCVGAICARAGVAVSATPTGPRAHAAFSITHAIACAVFMRVPAKMILCPIFLFVLVQSLNDTAPEVRDAGFAALASVIKVRPSFPSPAVTTLPLLQRMLPAFRCAAYTRGIRQEPL